MDATGKIFIDGYDLWTTFGIAVMQGSADFLRMAPRKQTTEHNWPDTNGVDVDTSQFFFDSRSGTLDCLMVAKTESDFWNQKGLFEQMIAQPGLRRLQITAHGQRSYYIIYKEITNWSQVKSLKGENGKTVQKFSLSITEPEPSLSPLNIFLITEAGKLLIS